MSCNNGFGEKRQHNDMWKYESEIKEAPVLWVPLAVSLFGNGGFRRVHCWKALMLSSSNLVMDHSAAPWRPGRHEVSWLLNTECQYESLFLASWLPVRFWGALSVLLSRANGLNMLTNDVPFMSKEWLRSRCLHELLIDFNTSVSIYFGYFAYTIYTSWYLINILLLHSLWLLE